MLEETDLHKQTPKGTCPLEVCCAEMSHCCQTACKPVVMEWAYYPYSASWQAAGQYGMQYQAKRLWVTLLANRNPGYQQTRAFLALFQYFLFACFVESCKLEEPHCCWANTCTQFSCPTEKEIAVSAQEGFQRLQCALRVWFYLKSSPFFIFFS